MDKINLNDIATLCGLIFGLAGFLLGILNYIRDRAKVTIELKWDMKITDNPIYDSNKKWAVVSVANIGRRPIYLSHANLRVPRSYDYNHLVLYDSLEGVKLSEGDPPRQFMLDQTDLRIYPKDWNKIRAEIIDSTGKIWRSRKLKKFQKPSWAKTPIDGEQGA